MKALYVAQRVRRYDPTIREREKRRQTQQRGETLGGAVWQSDYFRRSARPSWLALTDFGAGSLGDGEGLGYSYSQPNCTEGLFTPPDSETRVLIPRWGKDCRAFVGGEEGSAVRSGERRLEEKKIIEKNKKYAGKTGACVAGDSQRMHSVYV